MAKGILISIYDGKAETWTPPACADSKAAAIRQMEMLVNDKQQTLVSSHPEDFTLFMIGVFDDCDVKGCDKLALANGIDVHRKPSTFDVHRNLNEVLPNLECK